MSSANPLVRKSRRFVSKEEAALEASTLPELPLETDPEEGEILPHNIIPPTVTIEGGKIGCFAVGGELRINTGTWSPIPQPACTLQWLRDGKPIFEAVDFTYTIRKEDVGHTLTVIVKAQLPGGRVEVESGPSPVIFKLPFLFGKNHPNFFSLVALLLLIASLGIILSSFFPAFKAFEFVALTLLAINGFMFIRSRLFRRF